MSGKGREERKYIEREWMQESQVVQRSLRVLLLRYFAIVLLARKSFAHKVASLVALKSRVKSRKSELLKFCSL